MECIKKYLQAQRAVLPAMGAAAVATLASPLVFWWFVVKAGMGLDGAAYAFVCCQVMTLVGLLGYTVYRARVMEVRGGLDEAAGVGCKFLETCEMAL
jgi:MATE family multidrug resistance protein